jgi:hypothetical protein
LFVELLPQQRQKAVITGDREYGGIDHYLDDSLVRRAPIHAFQQGMVT